MLIKKLILGLSILLISVCGAQANFVDKSSKKIKASSANIEYRSFNIKYLNEPDEIIASDSILYIEDITEEEEKFTDVPQGEVNIEMMASTSEIY